MLGTPYYMSPEQAQGIKAVDARSDLWSLAVIVFQALTGKLPFESEALGDLLVRIIVAPVPMPSQLRLGSSADVRPVVGEGLAAGPGAALPERPRVRRRAGHGLRAFEGPVGRGVCATDGGAIPAPETIRAPRDRSATRPGFGNTANPASGRPRSRGSATRRSRSSATRRSRTQARSRCRPSGRRPGRRCRAPTTRRRARSRKARGRSMPSRACRSSSRPSRWWGRPSR